MYIIRETKDGVIAGKLLKTFRDGKNTYYRVSIVYNSEYDSDDRIWRIKKIGNTKLYKNKRNFINDLKLLLL